MLEKWNLRSMGVSNHKRFFPEGEKVMKFNVGS